MNYFDLELAYEMLLVEMKMNLAATRIAAIYKGARVRKELKPIIVKRKSATLFIQAIVRFKLIQIKCKKRKNDAVLLL